MVQSLASRSNLDGIPKSNTALQLSGTVVHNKNAKEHPKNKVNERELPWLIANVWATSLRLKENLKQKVLDKQKSTKSVSTKIFPFIPKLDLYPSDVSYHNKTLSDTSDSKL